MSGVAGCVGRKDESGLADTLDAMVGALAYRGDHRNAAKTRGRAGLGVCAGALPGARRGRMSASSMLDGGCWAAMTGGLDNAAALAKELDATGEDAALLAAAYARWGEACFEHFHGQYAMAIVDHARERVLLARDRLGTAPMYYSWREGRFLFANKVKALLSGGLARRFDPLAAMEWVFRGHNDQRHMVANVVRVPQGSVVRLDWSGGHVTTTTYYELRPDWGRAESLGADEQAWIRATDAELLLAVERQTSLFDRVGVLCSGGVDSSLLTAMAARLSRDTTAYTMSMQLSPSDDETPFAARVAKHCGVKLHTHSLTPKDVRDHTVRLVWLMETPLIVLNPIGLYQLALEAHAMGYPALLSGECADACFGGNLVRKNALLRIFRSRGRWTEQLLLKAYARFRRLADRMGFAEVAGYYSPSPHVHTLLTSGFADWASHRAAAARYERLHDPLEHELACELYWQVTTGVRPFIHRLDASITAAGLESWLPFMDTRLAELALAMPGPLRHGVHGWKPETKPLLRKLTTRYVPADIVYRRKMGFQVPPEMFYMTWPETWLRDGFVAEAFDLDRTGLKDWTSETIRHDEFRGDHSAFMLLTIEIWGQLFMRGRTMEDVADELRAAQPVKGSD